MVASVFSFVQVGRPAVSQLVLKITVNHPTIASIVTAVLGIYTGRFTYRVLTGAKGGVLHVCWSG